VHEDGKHSFTVEKLTAGDGQAWAEFLNEFLPTVSSCVARTFRSHTGEADPSDVEDTIQQVLTRLVANGYRLLRSYNSSRASLRTYLSVIATSTAIDALRRREPPAAPLDGSAPDPAARSETAPAAPEIPPGLLPPRQELIMALMFQKGWDVAEIAVFLGIKPQTVRSAKNKAVERLREHFGSP
jgi:RNA polymerase sigma factor (sigma-70 family)